MTSTFNNNMFPSGTSYTGAPNMNHLAGGRGVGNQPSVLSTIQGITGAPAGVTKWDLVSPQNTNGYTLPDILITETEDLGTALAFLRILVPNPLTDWFCPKKYTSKVKVAWRKVETKPMLAQRVAHRGVTRLFEESRTGGQTSLGRFMVNHMCELELAAEPFGQAYMDRVFTQMALAFEEAMQFEVLLKSVQAGNNRYTYDQKKRAAVGADFNTFREGLQQDRKMWDCLKDRTGLVWGRIKGDMDELCRRNGNDVTFDTVFATYRIVASSIENDRAKMSDGGQRAVDALEAGPFKRTTLAGLNIIYMTSARPRSFIADDLFGGYGTYGSVAAIPTVRGSYKRGMRDIRYYCMHAQAWSTIRYLTLLKHSGVFTQDGSVSSGVIEDMARFNTNGKFFSKPELQKVPWLQSTKSHAKDVPNSPKYGTDDWKVTDVAKGLETISTIGQMTKESFTRANLQKVVDDVLATLGDPEPYRKAIASAISICRAANATPRAYLEWYIATTDFFNQMKESTVRNNDARLRRNGTRTSGYETLDDAASVVMAANNVLKVLTPHADFLVATAYTTSDVGEFNGQTYAQNFAPLKFPPGHQTAQGFHGVAEAYAEGLFNQGSAYEIMEPTAKIVSEIVPLLEVVAGKFMECLPSDVLNVNHVRAPCAHPGALDVFFENFINPTVSHVMVNAAVTPLVASPEQWGTYPKGDNGAVVGPINAKDGGGTYIDAFVDGGGASITVLQHWNFGAGLFEKPTTDEDDFLAETRQTQFRHGAPNTIACLPPAVWSYAGPIKDTGVDTAHILRLRSICRSDVLYERVIHARSQYSSDPLRLAATLCVLLASFNYDTFEAMENHDVLAPLGVLYCKPEQRYLTTSVLVAQSGSRTMNLYVRPGKAMMGVDSIHRMGYWNGSMYFGAVIYKDSAFLLLRNMFVDRYLGGSADLPMFEGKSYYNPDSGYPPKDERRSWFAFLVGLDEAQVNGLFSVTGKHRTALTSYNLSDTDTEATRLQYSSAAFYNGIFGFTKARKDINLTAKTAIVNHICRQETIETWNEAGGMWNRQQGNDNFSDPDKMTFDTRCPQQYVRSALPTSDLGQFARAVSLDTVI